MKENIKYSMELIDYPNSLFDDERNLLLLAWIEKSGATSDLEVQEGTGWSKHLCNSLLMNLYQNKLIDYERNYIKISNKGKFTLERLNLSETLISDLIDSLKLSKKIGDELDIYLKTYRKTYYEQYLDTLKALQVWDTYAALNKESLLNSSALSFTRLVIVLFDLINIPMLVTDTVGKLLSTSISKYESVATKDTKATSVLQLTSKRKKFDIKDAIGFINNTSESRSFGDELDKVDQKIWSFIVVRNHLAHDNFSSKWYEVFSSYKTKDYEKSFEKAFDSFLDLNIDHYRKDKIQFKKYFNPKIEASTSLLSKILEVNYHLGNYEQIDELSIDLGQNKESLLAVLNELNMNLQRITNVANK